MNIHCSKEFDWLLPYLELGLSLTPIGKTVTRLTKLKFKGRVGRKEKAFVTTNNYRSYRIYIHTMYQPKGEAKALPFSSIDILELLSHELAHMIDMEHTPDHKILEARITKAFMLMLKKGGYVSEEYELSVA
jgi:hypothetical protein